MHDNGSTQDSGLVKALEILSEKKVDPQYNQVVKLGTGQFPKNIAHGIVELALSCYLNPQSANLLGISGGKFAVRIASALIDFKETPLDKIAIQTISAVDGEYADRILNALNQLTLKSLRNEKNAAALTVGNGRNAEVIAKGLIILQEADWLTDLTRHFLTLNGGKFAVNSATRLLKLKKHAVLNLESLQNSKQYSPFVPFILKAAFILDCHAALALPDNFKKLIIYCKYARIIFEELEKKQASITQDFFDNLIQRIDLFQEQKISFFMGSHYRLGKESSVYEFFWNSRSDFTKINEIIFDYTGLPTTPLMG